MFLTNSICKYAYTLWFVVESKEPKLIPILLLELAKSYSPVLIIDINTNDLDNVQRIEDLQTYIQALQSTSFALIRLEKYHEALNLLTIASALNNNPNLQKE